VSHVLEYGNESDLSIFRIREYGTTIASEYGLQTFNENFS
jgi:adapter protein MecA 1/2